MARDVYLEILARLFSLELSVSSKIRGQISVVVWQRSTGYDTAARATLALFFSKAHAVFHVNDTRAPAKASVLRPAQSSLCCLRRRRRRRRRHRHRHHHHRCYYYCCCCCCCCCCRCCCCCCCCCRRRRRQSTAPRNRVHRWLSAAVCCAASVVRPTAFIVVVIIPVVVSLGKSRRTSEYLYAYYQGEEETLQRRSRRPEMSDHGCIHLNNFKAAKGIQPYKVIHSYFVTSTSTEARVRKVRLSFSCVIRGQGFLSSFLSSFPSPPLCLSFSLVFPTLWCFPTISHFSSRRR